MSVSLDSNVKAIPGAFSSSVNGDLILFDPEKGSYFGSGPVGARIWELVEDGTVVKDICSDLMKDFSVDTKTCEQEVLSFLSELEQRGLVEIS